MSMGIVADIISRHVNNGPYWPSLEFWPRFLCNSDFDHYYLIELFKNFFSLASNRRMVIKELLSVPFNYHYSDCDDFCTDAQLETVRRSWTKAKSCGVRLIFTFKYPSLIDTEDNCLSHFCICLADPILCTVLHIDSRGLEYAENCHESYRVALLGLRSVFNDFRWTDYVYFDLQHSRSDDHFCQTWSLLLLEEVLEQFQSESSQINVLPVWQSDTAAAYRGLVSLWSRCMQSRTLRLELYRLLYAQTHCQETNQRLYHRYFSTLEMLVCVQYHCSVYGSVEDAEQSACLEQFLELLGSDDGSLLVQVVSDGFVSNAASSWQLIAGSEV